MSVEWQVAVVAVGLASGAVLSHCSEEAPTSAWPVPSSREVRYTVDWDELVHELVHEVDTVVPFPATRPRMMLHRGADGNFDGWRITALRPGSMAETLGLRNGDIVHAVNDIPTTSLQGAIDAYFSIVAPSTVCADLTRRRSPVRICYDLR
ncbi:MAG: PDZ domain-containing protein [Myxococcota bacterium]